MKKDYLQKGFLVTGLVLTTVLATTIIASADETSTLNQLRGKLMNSERNQEVREVMENGTYEDFKNLDVENERMAEKHASVTEEMFNKMKEASALRAAGDHEAARAIMEELGFDKTGRGKRGGEMNAEHRAEMEEIMETGDYAAFQAVEIPNEEMAAKHAAITEEQFNLMVEAHELKEAGDYEGAKEIMKELGFGPRMGMKGERGAGEHRMAR